MSEAAIYAEMAVLGGVMDGAEPPHLKPEHFMDPVHAALWMELRRRHDQGVPLHPIALKDWWSQDAGRRELDEDTPYLADLAREAPSHESVKAYADQVREHAQRRFLDEIGANLRAQAENAEVSPKEALESAEMALAGLAETGTTRKLISTGMALRSALSNLGRGASTGWADFDQRFMGWKPGRYYVIAGRPGMGKTLVGASVAIQRARQGEPVLFFSMEMSDEDLAIRIAAAMSGVPYWTIERGEMDRAQQDKLKAAMDEIDRLPLTLASCPGATVASIRNMVRSHDRDCQRRLNKKLAMVVVDYLGLISGEGRGRYEDMTGVSIALKQLSIERLIPVVTLAQLSRKVEERPNKRPVMSDLRDSGGIEQDADAVMLLYRDAYYAQQEDCPAEDHLAADWEARCASRELDIDIAKQRGGPTGRVTLYCDPATGEILDMDRRYSA